LCLSLLCFCVFMFLCFCMLVVVRMCAWEGSDNTLLYHQQPKPTIAFLFVFLYLRVMYLYVEESDNTPLCHQQPKPTCMHSCFCVWSFVCFRVRVC
jgi:hypothetical protein